MTHTKRELIVAAAHELLEGLTTIPPGRCYRSRVEAFARNEAPAVVVEPGRDSARQPEAVSVCRLDWSLQLVIAVYARAMIPDHAADPIIHEINSLLMADRTIGGLAIDIYPTDYDPQMEKAELPAGWFILSYTVRYRTSVDDLSG